MRRPGFILLVGGIASLAGAVLLVLNGRFGALSLVLGIAALPLILTGARTLGGPEPAEPSDFRHAYQVFGVIFGLLFAASLVRELALPDTWAWYGPYRGAAVADARNLQPKHAGAAACVECHEKTTTVHAKDAHARVQCENCHGPAAQHVRILESQRVSAKGVVPATDGAKKQELPEAARLPSPKDRGSCLVCHQRLDARPGSFPQVEWKEHFEFIGVKDEATECTRCHDPHEPLFMDKDLREARLHPIVHGCRDCHTAQVVADDAKEPPGHPKTFDCNYCHKEIARDFAGREHEKIACTTCHLFFQESEFAGRIIRDADPRFCLLCHAKADFRSDEAPAAIKWPDHREEMADNDADLTKQCVDCHRDNIHAVGVSREFATKVPAKPAGGSDE